MLSQVVLLRLRLGINRCPLNYSHLYRCWTSLSLFNLKGYAIIFFYRVDERIDVHKNTFFGFLIFYKAKTFGIIKKGHFSLSDEISIFNMFKSWNTDLNIFYLDFCFLAGSGGVEVKLPFSST